MALAAATDAADGAADALARCPSDDLRAPVVALRDLARDTAAQAAHWTTLAAQFDAGMHDLLHAAQRAKAVRGTSVHAARLQAVGASRDVGAALSVAATRYAALADAIDTANATTQVTLADVLAGRAPRGAL